MISSTPTITNAGINLFIRATGGEKIVFTRFKIGNGEIEGKEISTMKDLINPLVEFPINNIDTEKKGYVKLTGVFDNTYIQTDFRWKELGLFCKGEDNEEVLYAYCNEGDNAGMLRANVSNVIIEQTVALIIAVGKATNVTAILSESVLYASKKDVDNHINSSQNPHNVTSKQVGLGNVPNVSTNNQTPTYSVATSLKELVSGESLTAAFGKIAKAIKSYIDHSRNTENPHKVNVNVIGAAKKEHIHSASDILTGTLSSHRGGLGIEKPEKGSILCGNGADPCTTIKGVGALFAEETGKPKMDILPESLGGTGAKSIEEFKEKVGSGLFFGEYIGNGEAYQFVKVNKTIKFVKIICDNFQNEYTYSQYNGLAFNGMNAVVDKDYLYTDVSTEPTSYYHGVKVAIVDDGFYVYYCSSSSSHPKTNVNNQRYHYIIGA